MSITLSCKELREVTEEVKKQLPVLIGNPTLVGSESSVEVFETENYSIRGKGSSIFLYADGRAVLATWHLLHWGLELVIVVDPEQLEVFMEE